MATISIQQPHHPLLSICQLFALLDTNTIKQAIIQAWECVIDGFGQILGMLSPITMWVRLVFICADYGRRNPREEEVKLRELLAQCDAALNPAPYSKVAVVLELGRCLIYLGRYDEAESLISKALVDVGPMKSFRIIPDALPLLAWSQYCQDKQDLAERNMRQCIKMARRKEGKDSPEVVKQLFQLEVWLRHWGRQEDANLIRAETEECLGSDEDL